MEDIIPIKVCSHRRSGTHLLMKSLYDNFILPDVGKYVDTSDAQMDWYDGTDGIDGIDGKMVYVPWIKLFHTHNYAHEMNFDNFDKNKCIYIFRNGIDVLCSFYRSFKIEKDFNEWIADHIIKGWLYHVISWFEAGGIYVVCFDDLIDDFDKTMSKIEVHFDLKRKHDGFIRTDKRVGWSPSSPSSPSSKNGNNKAIQMWNEENLKMYNNMVDWDGIVKRANELN